MDVPADGDRRFHFCHIAFLHQDLFGLIAQFPDHDLLHALALSSLGYHLVDVEPFAVHTATLFLNPYTDGIYI